MKKSNRLFILVDDDPINNLLIKRTIERNLTEVEVKDFLSPEMALKFIETEFKDKASEENTFVFLDINMPTLTGWEFLEIFDTFSFQLKSHFNIYVLSSSIDPADIQRAKINPYVIDFIEKPLKKDFLLQTFGM